MKCIKCGSINLDVVKSGPHNKLVCVDCLAFQKFLNEVDTRTFLALQAKPKEVRDGDYIMTVPGIHLKFSVSVQDDIVTFADGGIGKLTDYITYNFTARKEVTS